MASVSSFPVSESTSTRPTAVGGFFALLSCSGAHGINSRFRYGHFGNLFSSVPHDAENTATHADTIVNLFTLGATLLLTCPYALMGSLQTSAWGDLRVNLASCASNPWNGSTPWGFGEVDAYVSSTIYPSVANTLLASIYSSFLTIIISIFYYMTRPNGGKDASLTSKELFKNWWPRGRVLLFFICCGMMASLVSVLTFSNVFYTNFISPASMFCVGYTQRWYNYIGTASSLAILSLLLLFIAV